MNTLEYFRLWNDENDQIDIDKSLRFKLLQARNENLPDFRDFKPVPSYDYLVRKKYDVFQVNINY